MKAKQHLSVVMLAARSTIYKVLALLLLMAVAQGILFNLELKKSLASQPVGLEQLIDKSRIIIVSGVGFLQLCVILSLTGSEFGGSRVRYTIKRLSIKEKTTVLWWAGYNSVCFFLFWVVQAAIALALGRLYITRMDPTLVSGQTMLLAFYRNSFLHSLLPLAEASRYIRNIVFAISLGFCASSFSWRQRRDQMGIAVFGLAMLTAVSFSKPMGSLGTDIFLSLVALAITASAFSGIRGDHGSEHEHHQKA